MYEKHKSECKAINKMVHMYQHSKFSEIIYRRIRKHIDAMQEKIFRNLIIKLEFNEWKLYQCQLYDHTELSVPLANCLVKWNYHQGTDFYSYFYQASKNYFFIKSNENKIFIDKFIRTDDYTQHNKIKKFSVPMTNDAPYIDEILSGMKLTKSDHKVIDALTNNYDRYTDKELAKQIGINEKTFKRTREKLKEQKNIYFFYK